MSMYSINYGNVVRMQWNNIGYIPILVLNTINQFSNNSYLSHPTPIQSIFQ